MGISMRANCVSQLLFFYLLFTVNVYSAVSFAGTKEPKNDIGILWEVSKGEIGSSYVFGTVHSEDERVINMLGPVWKAFNQSKVFILEMRLNKTASQAIMKAMYFMGDNNLQQVIGEKLFFRSLFAMKKKGFPADTIERMKPWAVFTILSMPEQKTGLFLDALLFQEAEKQEKIIYGLETPEEQTAVFDEMSMSSQIELLRSTLDNSAEMDKLLDEVISIYLTHDLGAMLALNTKYMAMIDKQVAQEFTQRLVTSRNLRMVERMLPLLEVGSAFVAVGALHLPGKAGILKLLELQGYRVIAKF